MSANPQHVVLFHHFRRLLEEAAREGIDVAPVKGAHLVTSVYPEGEDRGMLSDVDFLVRPEEFARAAALLARMGFRRVPCAKGRLVTGTEFYETGYTLDVGDGRRILFEAHRHFIQPARHDIDYAGVWRRSSPSTFDGAPCRRLAPEDHLLHAVIHMCSHQFVDPARHLRDIELLLRFGGADLEVAVARAREWECANAAWLALSLLDARHPELGLARAAASLAPSAIRRRAARFLVPDERGFRFPDLDYRAREAALWPWLLDGARPAVRFGAYYLGLRLRDLLAARPFRG